MHRIMIYLLRLCRLNLEQGIIKRDNGECSEKITKLGAQYDIKGNNVLSHTCRKFNKTFYYRVK